MNLHVEVSASFRHDRWVWRVRSDETPIGEACLAVGTSRISADDARRIGYAVQEALSPIFKSLPLEKQP